MPLDLQMNFFLMIFIYFAVLDLGCDTVFVWHENFWLQHVGSSSLTRDQTWVPCIGSV